MIINRVELSKEDANHLAMHAHYRAFQYLDPRYFSPEMTAQERLAGYQHWIQIKCALAPDFPWPDWYEERTVEAMLGLEPS